MKILPRTAACAKEALTYLEQGEKLGDLLERVDRLLEHAPVDSIRIRRDIASVVVEKEGYPLD